MTDAQEGEMPAAEIPPPSLRDQLRLAIYSGLQAEEQAIELADRVLQLLMEEGYYLPGAPPAQRILDDAKSFAERLTLSNLACRILNMLAWMKVETPETTPARKWLDDYLEGRGHGPIGKPMLWPARLPGMASLLRDWGFMPTPTMPPYVARALPTQIVQ